MPISLDRPSPTQDELTVPLLAPMSSLEATDLGVIGEFTSHLRCEECAPQGVD
jgi:hypothetical protein